MLLKYEENILCCLAALLWHIHPFDAVSVDVVIEGGMCSADVSLLFLGCIYDHFAAFPLSWNTHTHTISMVLKTAGGIFITLLVTGFSLSFTHGICPAVA